MNDKPLVSVIIPVYNGAGCIGKAIESLKNQNFRDFEVIIIDDGSTDDTCSKVNELCRDFEHITIVKKSNEGVSSARNEGINRATGKFIAFLDADDVWVPGKLEQQVNILNNNPQTGLIFSSHIQNTTGNIAGKYNRDKSGSFLKTLIHQGNFITTSSVMLRKEILEKHSIRFNTSLSYGEDWLFWIILSQYCDFLYLSKPLVVYSVSPFRKYDYDRFIRIYRAVLEEREKYPLILHNTRRLPVFSGIWLFTGLKMLERRRIQSVFLILASLLVSPRKVMILYKIWRQ